MLRNQGDERLDGTQDPVQLQMHFMLVADAATQQGPKPRDTEAGWQRLAARLDQTSKQ